MTPASHTTLAELERIAPAIRSLLRRLVRDEATVDDVLQEARLTALRRPPSDGRNVVGWIRVVARNLALQRLRGEASRRRRELRAARDEAVPSTCSAAARLEAHRRVLACIERLDEPERSLVVGRYLDGVPAAVLAARSGLSRASVNRRLSTARDRLREKLAPASSGHGRRWAPALLAIAAEKPTAGSAGLTTAAIGGATMTANTGVLVGGACALGIVLGWVGRPMLEGGAAGDRPRDSQERLVAATPTESALPDLEGRAPDGGPEGGVDAAADRDEADGPEVWLSRFNAANRSSLRALCVELCALDADASRDILESVFAKITPAWRRISVLRTVAGLEGLSHVHAAAILERGARDPDLTVQNAALDVASRIARQDLAGDRPAYEAWIEASREHPLEDVVGRGLRSLFDRIETKSGEELEKELEWVSRAQREATHSARLDMLALYRDAGAGTAADAIWRDPKQTGRARQQAGELLIALGMDEAYVREHVVSVIDDPSDVPHEVYHSAIRMLAKHGQPWSTALLRGAFETAPRKLDWWQIATALAELRDASSIPTMIAMIQADNEYSSKYGIGYFGLSKLTGVKYDENHDAAWWERWWKENKTRFGDSVAALEIPRLRPIGR